MKILDCTLRDGGYYNQWNFSIPEVNKYLDSANEAGIDYVEIGFRFTPKSEYFGPFAYSTDSFLNTLKIPKNLKIGVMLDLKDIISSENQIETLNKMFQPRASSPVELVRIACHVKDVLLADQCVKFLKDFGYKVGLNIMQANTCTPAMLTDISLKLHSWKNIDVLYYADSLGNMMEAEMMIVKNAIRAGWPGPIGVHTHNNMGQALSNSIWAMNNDVEWIDATITGMGRGAGNAELELLLIEAEKVNPKYKSSKLVSTLYEYFYPLKAKYSWGANYFYYLAAIKQIHPTYIQQMLNEDRYSPTDILSAINQLTSSSALSYSKNSLDNAIKDNYLTSTNYEVNSTLFASKKVLIFANTDDCVYYKKAVEDFIKKEAPIVICLNDNGSLSSNLVSYYTSCHPTRIAALREKFTKSGVPIITPKFDGQTATGPNDLNYGLKISEKISITPNSYSTDIPLVGTYAISFAIAAGATNIYCIGLKGYNADDYRQVSMNHFISYVHDMHKNVRIIALTPTTYNVEQSSLYAPW